MEASVRALRRRRRRYTRSALTHRILYGPRFRLEIPLPGGRYLAGRLTLSRRRRGPRPMSWPVRLVLWAVFAAAAWLALGWPGIPSGLVAAIVAELVVAYRWSAGAGVRTRRPAGPGSDPGGLAGVREPRSPRPSGWSGAEERPVPPHLG
jgi:hypothetical protein